MVALCSTTSLATPTKTPKRQAIETERAAAVKEAFQFAWDGYFEFAFPHDELHPVSNNFSDSR